MPSHASPRWPVTALTTLRGVQSIDTPVYLGLTSCHSALPQLSCADTGGLGGLEQPLAEEIQRGTPIALPLQELYVRDLAFDLAVPGRPLSRGLHGGWLAR